MIQNMRGTKLYCIKVVHNEEAYYMHEYVNNYSRPVESVLGLYHADEVSVDSCVFSNLKEVKRLIKYYIEANNTKERQVTIKYEDSNMIIQYVAEGNSDDGLYLPYELEADDFIIEEYLML